jgi:integrase
MVTTPHSDRRYLQFHHGSWYVVVGHRERGTDGKPSKVVKARRSLHTASLREAQRARWRVVGELKAIPSQTHPEAASEAWRDALATSTGEPDDPVETALSDHLDRLEAQHGTAYAKGFADRAYGRATPVDAYWEPYLASLAIAERTKGVHRRALGLLRGWAEKTSTAFTVQAMTRKAAIRFLDDLPTTEAKGRSPNTPRYLTLLVGKLSLYWRWMIHREHAETDPWQGLKLAKPRTPHDQLERPFTDSEVNRLLTGPATRSMLDLIRVGLLTGARLDAITSLHVGDCQDGVFTFKPQKSEPKPRRVPVHSSLVEMVAGRMAGKASTDLLFPHLRDASNAFGDYRRGVGVDEVVKGNRRSRVNFHSARRWWITKAEQAGLPDNLIGAVVGHRRPGLSLGLYSSGPSLDQLRTAIEAVKLPLSNPLVSLK